MHGRKKKKMGTRTTKLLNEAYEKINDVIGLLQDVGSEYQDNLERELAAAKQDKRDTSRRDRFQALICEKRWSDMVVLSNTIKALLDAKTDMEKIW